MKDIVLTNSPIDDVLCGLNPAMWPDGFIANVKSQEEVVCRQSLHDNMQYLFEALNEAKNLSALEENANYSLDRVKKTYDELGKFIQPICNRRIILYLPFILFPNKNEKLIQLEKCLADFSETYLKAWFAVLPERDLRANFFNGDVLEDELLTEKRPLVCKGAHLIPFLLQKGLLSVARVCCLLDDSKDDKVLVNSILDSILASLELRVTSLDEWLNCISLDFFDFLKAEKTVSPYLRQSIFSVTRKPFPVENNLRPLLKMALKDFIDYHKYLSKNYDYLPKKRFAWEIQEERRTIIENYGLLASRQIINDYVAAEEFANEIVKKDSSLSVMTFIVAVRLSLEQINLLDELEARQKAEAWKSWLFKAFKIDSQEIKMAVEKTLYHLFHLGIIEKSYLTSFGLKIFSWKNISKSPYLTEAERTEMQNIIQAISDDAQLAKYFYPLIAVYGSRTKGYGKYSDLDLAFFVKPDVDFENRELLNYILSDLLNGLGLNDLPLQFWLTKSSEKLVVTDYLPSDKLIGNDYYSHVLFGACYFGNQESISQLYNQLLIPEMKKDDYVLKMIRLRELEKDNLQYRFLHKSYDHFFSRKKINTGAIDADCPFYEDAYREIASLIFMKKVFIPIV